MGRKGRSSLLAVLLTMCFSLSATFVQAEGTKQLAPNPDEIVMLLLANDVYGNFAAYDGPASSRLYFQIKNPSEVVYLGLSRNYRANGAPESTGSYSFRIRRASDGAVVHGPFTVHAFNENVSSWEDAVLGPAALTGQGYATTDSRFFFDPTQAGEYYIEFDINTATGFHIGFWDITVADNGVAQAGRLYSTNWAFRTPTKLNESPECVWDREFNGILYSYTSDGFVTKIDFSNSGFQGLSFNVAFNRTGPGISGDPQLDRMSVEGQNLTENSAEHLIFLNEPDQALFPDGECGTANVGQSFQCTGEGGFCLEASVTQPGQVEIVLDFNKNGIYDEGLDIRLLEVYDDPNALSGCIPWDGVKGDGTRPGDGETVNLIVQYTQGVQHWALYDGEFLKNGFCVEPVRPICDNGQSNLLYWDDRNISDDPGTTSPKDGRAGCNCAVDNCRTWNYFDPNVEDCRFINDDITIGYGDKSTLNTWWFARNVFTTFSDISFPGVSIVASAEEICAGETATLTMSTTSTSVTSIVWEGPNGIISQGGANNTQITVTTGGTYTVTVEEANGCASIASIDVIVTNCPVDVELDKLADVLEPSIGQVVNFDIVITNKGPGVASGITIEDRLPDGLTNISAISNGGILNGDLITWSGITLGEGETLALSYRARVGLGLSYTNLAEVTTMDQQDIDSNPGNGVDTDGDGNVVDDPGDEDDGDAVVLTPIPCSMGVSVTNVVCNDNGTPVDPSDDTFTFQVMVNATNASNGWIANDPAGSTGTYGQPFRFGPYPISGGVVSFQIRDGFFGDVCSIPISVSPPPSCSDQCLIETEVSNVLCNDNGTPSDPTDDTYTFDLVAQGFNAGTGWTTTAASGTYGQSVSFGPFLISGGATQLTLVDTGDSGCTAAVIVQAPASCSGECAIVADISNVICDNNGTPSHPEDDQYYFDILVTGSNVSETGWAASNGLEGTYGQVLRAGPYPISGGGFSLQISDRGAASCTTTAAVAAPATCSDECLIEALATNLRCDDNGTLSDSSDDLFYFDLTVTGLNTGSGWTSSAGHSGVYGATVTLGPFLINEDGITLRISDNADAGCFVRLDVSAPPSCSNLCALEASIENIYCDDNGTASNPTDDVYFAEVRVTGANTSPLGFNIGTGTGQYNTLVTVGPFPIADGDVILNITDREDPVCTTSLTLTAPAETCSEVCEISVEILNIQCDDNGTPTLADDDLFTFDVIVNGFNYSESWVSDEGVTGAYGEVTTLGPFSIAEGNVSTNITDAASAACTVEVVVEAPEPCSNDCEIVSAGLRDLLCDDNGTPADPADDTYTFALQVTGNNVSGNWTSNLGVEGAYGAPVLFGPYPISEGGKAITIADAADPECQLAFFVQAPPTCSEECAITATAIDILCEDSGTPSHKEDDIFVFQVVVEALNNAGSAWTADDGTSGTYGEAVTFGPYPISEGDRSIVITSVDFPDCQYVLEVSAPEPCSNQCLIEAEVIAVDCNDSNTPNTSLDDYFTYQLIVTGLNTGGSWTASDGTTGTYDVAVESVRHPVSIGETVITITDDASGECQVEITVSPPPVQIECPEDAFRGTVLRNALILEGRLEDTDPRFADADSLCWLPTEQFQTGDHYYDLYTIRHDNAANAPQVYTFYLFSDIPAGQNLPLGLDGTGGLFFGPYYPEDPCCFLQTSDIRSRPLDIGQLLENPQINVNGFFSKPYESIVKFTVLLAPDQVYSLITTTLSKETEGDYAWLIVSEPGNELEVVNGDFDLKKSIEITVGQELTFFDRNVVLNNPASTTALGMPILDTYCGVDSITFKDQITDLGECEDLTINREFKVYAYGSTIPLDSCEQKLTLRRPNFDDIVLPPEAILYACDAEFDTLANGLPAPSASGYPLILTQTGYTELSETHNYNLTIAYKDNIVQVPGSFTETFRRDWTILDVCNDTLLQYSQLIKIGGFTDPIVECPVSNHYCPILEGNIMLFPLDPFECTATVEAPLPDIINTCGVRSWMVRTEVLQVVGADTLILATFEPGEERVITGLSPADYLFRYTVFDNEDHVVEKLCVFRVADTQEPTAVCRSNLTFSLNELTDNRILVDQINQGSYDNCGIAKIEVRRVYHRDPVSCDTLSAPAYSEWGEFIEVGCCDINSFVTIEMRVTDIYGIENLCWLDARIEDHSTPSVVGTGAITVNCSDLSDTFNPRDSVSLRDEFGFPVVLGNCLLEVIELKPILQLTECGSGTIERRFLLKDRYGFVYDEIYTQFITINEYREYLIGFPADAVTDCVDWADTLILRRTACDSLEVTYVDEFLDPLADECYRIARTYHVISHCEWDGESDPVAVSRDEDCNGTEGESRTWVLRRPNNAFIDQDTNPNNNIPASGTKGDSCDGTTNTAGYWREVTSTGYWTYTQIVRVYDQTPPQISFVALEPVCTDSSACTAAVLYPFTVDDACVLDTLKEMKVELDVDADGNIDSDLTNSGIVKGTYPDFVIDGDFGIGRYEFVITATDYCGNTSSARMPLRVVDCYVPTPLCHNDLVVNLEALDPVVDLDGDGHDDVAGITVSAADLAAVNVAECSTPLRFSVNRPGEIADVTRTSISFTCNDRYSDSLEVYVWDSADNPYSLQPDGSKGGANVKSCRMLIFIQDNDNVCPDCESSPVVEGTIATESGLVLPVVDMEISALEMVQMPVDRNGAFRLTDLSPGAGYTIAPHWDQGHRNGLSTMDLMLVRAHILGTKPLHSPYKLIAADVNNSGNISALDLLEMRQVLLGELDRFPNNTSWRFVDMHYYFPDVYNPWKEAFPESVVINQLLTCTDGVDFAAIKIGDVNESASFDPDAFNGARGNGAAVVLQVEDRMLQAGEEVVIPFRLDDAAKVLGFQFTLGFDPTLVEVSRVAAGLLQPEQVGMRFAAEGALTFSWDRWPMSATVLGSKQDTTAFSLLLKARTSVRLSDLFRISSRITPAEGYFKLGESTAVELVFGNSTAEGADLKLYQNRPNPFGDHTIIGFDLPEDGKVSLRILDVSGRLVWQQQQEYLAGYHEMRVDVRDLPGEGMFYYTLLTNQGTLTKKFIVVQSRR